MTAISDLKTHRAWEDWLAMCLGALVILSPAIDPGSATPTALLNGVVVGFLVICLAMSELILIERWEEGAEVALGAWLVASPSLLGYGGWLGSCHMILGVLIAVLAALEYWQDRRRIET